MPIPPLETVKQWLDIFDKDIDLINAIGDWKEACKAQEAFQYDNLCQQISDVNIDDSVR